MKLYLCVVLCLVAVCVSAIPLPSNEPSALELESEVELKNLDTELGDVILQYSSLIEMKYRNRVDNDNTREYKTKTHLRKMFKKYVQDNSVLRMFVGGTPANVKAPVLARAEKWFVEVISRAFRRLLDARTNKIFKPWKLFNEEFKIRNIAYTSADPRANFDSVIIFTLDNDAKLVYKPSSIDVYKYVQSSDATSFATLLNSKLPMGTQKLPTYRVISLQDGVGQYGYSEFVGNPDKSISTIEQLKSYSFRAGLLTALSYIVGHSDLHNENVMLVGKRPYIIDAETAFQPYPFKLRDSALFTPNKGGLVQENEILPPALHPAGDANGASRPVKRHFEAGFDAAIAAVRTHSTAFTTWANSIPNDVKIRVVVIPTDDGPKVRGMQAQDKNCNEIFNYLVKNRFGRTAVGDPAQRDETYAGPLEKAFFAFFENNCQKFALTNKDTSRAGSTPMQYVKFGEQRVFHAETDEPMVFNGIPKPSTHAQTAFDGATLPPPSLVNELENNQGPANDQLLASTPKQLLLNRIAGLSTPANVAQLKTELTALMTERNFPEREDINA